MVNASFTYIDVFCGGDITWAEKKIAKILRHSSCNKKINNL